MEKIFNKYRFWFNCWGIVCGISCLVFSLYIFSFFLGNHDWQYLRYGTPLDAGVWEARITQFVLPVILFSGHVLPVVGALVGFLFLSAASIFLAKWYELPQKKIVVVCFALLIVLHPYICSQLYYTYLVPSLLLWHFCSVAGCVFLWEFINQRRYSLLLSGVGLLLVALCGYAACIELILTVVIGKFLLDISAQKRVKTAFVKKYFYFGEVVFVVLLVYAGIISGLKKYGIIDTGMYNTQSLPLNEVFYKILQEWFRPFEVLATALPYSSLLSNVCVAVCFLICLFSMKENKVLSVVGFGCLIYALFCAAFISPHGAFHMFRIHVYSVPYFAAILFAFVLKNGKKEYRNIVFVLSCWLVFLFIKADVITQKIWYLGDKQDKAIVERVKNDLLPELKHGKHYRLSAIGNLYGWQKFANIRFFSDTKREIYREYWGGPYFIPIFFSAGFWAYEAENPIWGDALYLGNDIFYGTSNENIRPEEVMKARIFAWHFDDEYREFPSKINTLQAFPKEPYFIVGKKNIVLMMDNDRNNKMKLLNKIRKQLNR